MKKIPLETTIVGAYRFLFTRIVSIIGTIWFPYALFLGLAAGAVYLAVPREWLAGDFSHFSPEQLFSLPLNLARLVVVIAGMIVAPMVMVGLMRHALGLKKSTTVVYFSLGAPVWRMLGAYLLGALIIVGVCVVLAVLFGVGVAAGAALLPKELGVIGGIVAGVFGVAFGCAIIYAAFRLFFFLPAVVVAENRIGLGRSWSLGGGNFWRMFLVYLAIVVPVWIVVWMVLAMTILPVLITAAMRLPQEPSPTEAIAFLRSLLPLLPMVVTVMVVAGIAARGLLAGAIGTAYNAVAAPVEPVVPVEPTAPAAPIAPEAPTEGAPSA